MPARRSSLAALPLLVAALLAPAAAVAAPPPNDDRAAPQRVALPSSTTGTLVEATAAFDDPGLSCATPAGASVFYEVQAPSDTRIALVLAADGDLDAAVDVFRRTRSQLSAVACEVTDEEGQAGITFRPEADATYLVRVSQRAGSVSGTFRLDASLSKPEVRPPGRPLNGVVEGAVDPLQDVDAAYALRMAAGTTYKVNLAQLTEDRCVALELHGPGTRDFDESRPVRRLRCGGYLTFTPDAGEGGTYSLRVVADRGPVARQRYRLAAGRAGADDTAPGVPIGNGAPVRGSLDATRADVVDLLRFGVTKRSALSLDLAGLEGAELLLLTDTGKRVARTSEGELDETVRPGRYFVAVQAPAGLRGSYRLTRVTRQITGTSVVVGGKRSASTRPGRAVTVAARTTPGVTGPVRFTVERFDPLTGWSFLTRLSATTSGGRAAVRFLPPGQGRYRVRAEFRGTRRAAPSRSGFARLLVAPPLSDDRA